MNVDLLGLGGSDDALSTTNGHTLLEESSRPSSSFWNGQQHSEEGRTRPQVETDNDIRPPSSSCHSGGFDLLSGSPIKSQQQQRQPVQLKALSSDSLPDFAKPPKEREEDDIDDTRRSVNLLDLGTPSSETISNHESVNLLDFGTSVVPTQEVKYTETQETTNLLDVLPLTTEPYAGESLIAGSTDLTDPFQIQRNTSAFGVAPQASGPIHLDPFADVPVTITIQNQNDIPPTLVPPYVGAQPVSDAFDEIGKELTKRALTTTPPPIPSSDLTPPTSNVKASKAGTFPDAPETVESIKVDTSQEDDKDRAHTATPGTSTCSSDETLKNQEPQPNSKPTDETSSFPLQRKKGSEESILAPEVVNDKPGPGGEKTLTEVKKEDNVDESSAPESPAENLQSSVNYAQVHDKDHATADFPPNHGARPASSTISETVQSTTNEKDPYGERFRKEVSGIENVNSSDPVNERKGKDGTASPNSEPIPSAHKGKKTEAISQRKEDQPSKPATHNPSTPERPITSSSSQQETPKETSDKASTLPGLSTPNPTTAPENSPNTPLPDRILWLEKELHAAHSLIMQFQNRKAEEEEKPGDAIMVELQANLQSQMSLRAEAEDVARRAFAETKILKDQLQKLQSDSESIISKLQDDLVKVCKEKSDLQVEFDRIREERDEQARKEAALTNRLNAAKKKEAIKANAAEHYEDQVDFLESQVEEYKRKLEATTTERDLLKKELSQWKQYAERRTKQLESALSDEKKLNDERKRKMKEFVEAKTEEVRSAKSDNISLQTELDQTNRTLNDLNQRHKQLHAQWVQSQTRNRELQRDITKMMKDSEKMSKVGGTLEAKLSRSEMESEDHKNKRLAAKTELMAVLRQLEAEREVNNRIRESIKVTFTPKALSQQQTIQEALDELESALHKLATRLRRPLPPPPVTMDNTIISEQQTADEMTGPSTTNSNYQDLLGDHHQNHRLLGASDAHTTKVLNKLEQETQRVSQSIMAFSTSVERLNSLLAGPDHRTCIDALSSLIVASRGSNQNEETTSMTGMRPSSTTATRRIERGAPRYGQVSTGALT